MDDTTNTAQPDPVQPAPADPTTVDGDKDQVLANADRNAARSREKESQDSDNRGWLYRNINPLMALLVVTFSFVFFLLVLKLNLMDSNRKDIVIYLLGGVQSLVITVVGYYFGSSKGSSDKARFIEKSTKS
jgi:hypothetical protein